MSSNFEVSKTDLSHLTEKEYYMNRKLKKERYLSYYQDEGYRDTADYTMIEYNNLGVKESHTTLRKERDYFMDERSDKDTLMVEITIFEDRILNKSDTLNKKEIKLM